MCRNRRPNRTTLARHTKAKVMRSHYDAQGASRRERRKYGALRQVKQEDQQPTAEPQDRRRESAGERISRDSSGREGLEFISICQDAQLDPSLQNALNESEPRDCRVGSSVGCLVGRGVRSNRKNIPEKRRATTLV